MWKYLAALLVVLLSLGGLVAAQAPCVDCYSNVITQIDVQQIQNVKLGLLNAQEDDPKDTVAVGNEGLSAAVIVAKAPVEPADGDYFVTAPFARIDQRMDQVVSNLGMDPLLEGAKGITWNKAIQAAWIANQGVKELEEDDEGELYYAKEGASIAQSTTQIINNVFDYQAREGAKILNVDNKLAMIVDDMNAVINLQANADSSSTDSQASNGNVTNNVNVTIAGKDP